MPQLRRLAIVGVGLVGGSVGLAARRSNVAAAVVGVGRRAASLAKAVDCGAIDRGTTNLAEGVADADLVVVATPVATIVDAVRSVAHAEPRANITDAGSTKAEICRQLRKGNDGTVAAAPVSPSRFVGSHPLAGDHRTGPEHARGDLFEGRTVVITPENDTAVGLVERVREFWEALGAKVVLLSPEEHDRALAATSHLPHLVAAALAGATPEEWLELAATGWADATRIAAGDPDLWTQIFHQNRSAVIDALRRFEHRLGALEEAIALGDGPDLTHQLHQAKRIRDALEIDLHPRAGLADRAAERVAAELAATDVTSTVAVAAARAFLVQAPRLSHDEADRLARELLADIVVEDYVTAPGGDPRLTSPPARLKVNGGAQLVHVLLKPGVMDPVAQSAEAAVRDFGWQVDAVRTLRKYWIAGASAAEAESIGRRLLANDAIEQVVIGPLPSDSLHAGSQYRFKLRTISLQGLDDDALVRLSRQRQLYLQLAEMQTIQRHFAELDREPTDVELETIAQTWSEHCSHKTLAGRIAYRDENGERQFENMLKETIFAATESLRTKWGADDWCVSVFRDNAGIVKFDDHYNVAFKVETHNHPSALEPYGGANTGLGGVIRDIMGTGLGARPVCSTDVFCFAPPDTPAESLPTGVLHPRRVMRGVVEGVRDYGNRMGIPTVNGAVYFDPRYVGNPLVFCGNVGLIPRGKSFKSPRAGDLIVAVGGRTGRDGIHGATFSSAELTHESESLSGGAVQIGNAIEEKKVLDVLLAARDLGLYTAVTDCGAGGFSSAVGEMGEMIGAEVHLDRAPVKYAGLSYTEIWISEAQERMVLSVPEEHWPALHQLCQSEGVEATSIGRFQPTGRLTLKYEGHLVGELPMSFLHDGRPPVVRRANFSPRAVNPLAPPSRDNYTSDLLCILSSRNVASKESIIRQYDHEVQGGSVIKPLVGLASDGPSDAAVVRPLLESRRGLVISCGMNPRYGDFDPYQMATSAIDEAVRNCVAVGADPARIAILDNFCWGDCERSETLGSLVRAALACHDLSLALETPFISGKDSLNNEFSYYAEPSGPLASAGRTGEGGSPREKRTIAIPPSLLISAMGQIDDVSRCVTMDLKQPGNSIYLVGETKDELGGSHFALVNELDGGAPPRVDPERAKTTFAAMHRAISAGLVAACHDLSEGGLAVAAAEMAFAGGFGAELDLSAVPVGDSHLPLVSRLFSESNTRFLCEVRSENTGEFERCLAAIPFAAVGQVRDDPRLRVAPSASAPAVIDAPIAELKEAWQKPLRQWQQ